jgi:hypothetical protein
VELTAEEKLAAELTEREAIELAKEMCLVGTSDGRVLMVTASTGGLKAFFRAASGASSITGLRVDHSSPNLLTAR